uniref:Juvenile hormone esterase binding protein n=1 Tax=Rhipicephalus pulchellus TaxID=72859 RepID=L7M6M9_RHIPC
MYLRTFQLPVSLRLVQNVLPRAVRTASTPRVLCAAHIHTTRSRRDAHPQGRGRSFVLQNPFRWLSLFFDFMNLKNQWDPDFNRSEFIEGTKLAISTVLTLIATQRLDDLAGLVKREAVNQFIQEVSQELGYGSTRHLKDPDDIVAMPQKVTLQSIVDHKYCDIQMQFIVMKNLEREQASSDMPRILMCFIFAKFHRNYTAGVLPEWTITKLSLLRTSSIS